MTTPDAERFARALKAASISMTHRVAAASWLVQLVAAEVVSLQR